MCVVFFILKKYTWRINWKSYEKYVVVLKLVELLVCEFWEALEVDLDISWFMMFSCFYMFNKDNEGVLLNFLCEMKNLNTQVWKEFIF